MAASIVFQRNVSVGGVATNADSTPTISIVRLDTMAVVVATTSTGVTNPTTGRYSYTLTPLVDGATYRATWTITVNGQPITASSDATAPSATSDLTIAAIIDQARKITGNKRDIAHGEAFVDDPDVTAALRQTIDELGRRFGDSSKLKEKFFDSVANQQDYDIETYVGADVDEVVEVLRSRNCIPNRYLADSMGTVDPVDGTVIPGTGVIPSGYQPEVFDVMVGQARARKDLEHDWEISPGDAIRLYPPPTEVETIFVSYTTATSEVGDLPTKTERTLVLAAVLAILNGAINRVMSAKAYSTMPGQTTDIRLRVLNEQRDYYQRMYDAEYQRLTSK